MNSMFKQLKYSGMAAIALTMLAAVIQLAGIPIPAQAQTETVLYSFSGTPSGGPDGAYPDSGPTLQGTTLYGTTSQGGNAGDGIVWSVSTTTGKETVLYAFQGGQNDGYYPFGGMAYYKGGLYGTACGGPRGQSNSGTGMIFKLTKSGKTGYAETVLHVFDQTYQFDGVCPMYVTPVFDKLGNMYGTTQGGGWVNGSVNGGTVFKLAPNGTLTTLHSFNNCGVGTDGCVPQSGVTLDKKGNLYGTTASGGTYTYGTLYEITASGTYKVLYNFQGGNDGSYPYAPPVLDKKGNLYGTTKNGGTGGFGTIWEFNPITSQETILHNFPGYPDGSPWAGALVFDKQGNLYGTTDCCGAGGTIYKLAPDGTLTTLHSFSNQPDGAAPMGAVVFDKLGKLYTTTYGGGVTANGAVIKLTP